MKSNREISLDKIEKLTNELEGWLDDQIEIFINLNKSSYSTSEIYTAIGTANYTFFINTIKNISDNMVNKKDADDFFKKMKIAIITVIDNFILENKKELK